MILKYYGGYISIDTLSTLCKTTKKGTSAYHIIKVAKDLGFHAEGLKCDIRVFIEKAILPVIAHVIVENTHFHYVVIYEVNPKKGYLIIADPATKIKKVSFSHFASMYNETILTFIPQKKLPYEKENTSFYPMMFTLFKQYRKECMVFLSLSIIFTIFSIMTTFYLSSIVESIVYHSYSYTKMIFLIFLLFYLCKSISHFFRNLIHIYIQNKIDFVFTKETFHKILSLPYYYYKNHTTGDVVSRINDISTIKNIIGKFLLFLFVDLFLSFFSFLILYQINKTLCCIVALCIFSYIPLFLIAKQNIEIKISAYQNQRSETYNILLESISGFETIKGHHLEKYVEEKYQKDNIKLLEKTKDIVKINSKIQLASEILENIGYLSITYITVKKMMKGSLQTTILFPIIHLYQYIITPIKTLFLELPSYKETIASYKRVASLFQKTEKKGFLSYPIEGKIQVKNLLFSYLEDHILFQNVTFSIEKGEKVLLLGQSGIGKSTFLKLLKRYYEIERGNIWIDEIDICDYKESQIEEDICYISQNETLFTGTLYENLTLGKRDDKWLTEVIKICALDPIVTKDTRGIYQIIEEGGYHLSGGEKQRIILGRSLMHSFRILLIDEGFSELDPALERKIVKKLFRVYLNKTIIVVSHRMDNIDLYDKIIQFGKDGVKQFKKGTSGNYSMV